MLATGLRQLHPGDDRYYPQPFCVPASTTPTQLADAGVKYLKANPDARHYNAASALLLAF
jgi:hypothetical protein